MIYFASIVFIFLDHEKEEEKNKSSYIGTVA
jgi:hypothetical protein